MHIVDEANLAFRGRLQQHRAASVAKQDARRPVV